MTVDLTIHFMIHCVNCGAAMLLPADTLQRPFSDPDAQPNDSLAIGIVCHFCKSAERYFLHKKNPNWNPKDQAVAMETRIEDTVLVNTLGCEEETCEFLVPLFAQWNPATTEEERRADILLWKWDRLLCSKGHSIAKPDW